MISSFAEWARGRPIVGFGAGELVDRALGADSIEVDYFIDDQLKETLKNGRTVHPVIQLHRETREIAIVVFSRQVGPALARLAGFGYRWGHEVIDGRYFGFGAPYPDDYEILKDESALVESDGIEVFLGPGATLRVRNIVLPRRRNSPPVRVHVGKGATLELNHIVLEGNSSISVGQSGHISIGQQTSIGAGCRLGASAFARMVIGQGVLVSNSSILDAATGTAIEIGDGSTFGEHLEMYAYAPIWIGQDCMLSSYIYAESGAGHDLVVDGKKRTPRGLRLGDHVWVGLGATLLSGASIGSGSMIGTRAVINSPVGMNALILGNPAGS
jgi:acetyltransferase-like isoleucine patch superfamily enzyme